MNIRHLISLFCHVLIVWSFTTPIFAANRCADIFKKPPPGVTSPESNRKARKWNPDPTRRSLSDTMSYLFVYNPKSLLDRTEFFYKKALEYFRDKSVVLELGSSYGEALSELVLAKDLDAVATDIAPRVLRKGIPVKGSPKGRYHPEVGWAEDILLRHENKVDDIIDVWGAVAYTPARILLIERSYNALREGGRARFACTIQAAYLNVFEILVQRFPEIFQLEYNSERDVHVLIVTKKPGLPKLVTGLKDGKTEEFYFGSLHIPIAVILENGNVLSVDQ